MINQNYIRETAASNWDLDLQAGKSSWLIKGDFDHFRLTNDLYGSLIADYLRDWTLDVIEDVLRLHQKSWGSEDHLCSVMGDDVTIYIPPSTLTEEDITHLLWKIRQAIKDSFWRRYRIGALPLPWDFFENVPVDILQTIRNELEEMDVILDFASRRRGFLILIPVEENGNYLPTLEKVIHILQRAAGKQILPVELLWDWIYNPDQDTCSTFNHGLLDPPSISFAACSARMGMGLKSVQGNWIAVYDWLSSVCQSALKTCKQTQSGVVVLKDPDIFAGISAQTSAFPVADTSSHMTWSSERYLREKTYFKRLDQPVLFQLNPLYYLTSNMPVDLYQIAKYRGNSFGIGLKGINEILGQKPADRVICLLLSIFTEGIRGALARKGIPLERVFLAQHVDRLTLCSDQPIFQLPEIVEFVRFYAARFNSLSEEIKISYLRTSVVHSKNPLVGYHLFNQLALTSLSSWSSILIQSNPRIELLQNRSFALREGSTTLERSSFLSSQLLGAYHAEEKALNQKMSAASLQS